VKPSKVLFRLKESLGLDIDDFEKIYSLQDYEISKERLQAILAKPNKKIFQEATYEELGVFLDGLFEYKRGEKPKVLDDEVELDNNLILKKIRGAFRLKDIDIEMIFQLGEREISRSKIKNLFRNPNHPKFQECSDGVLNDFLIGFDEFMYGVDS
jgi:uncharacterized protein YehS (DUF1456 family)